MNWPADFSYDASKRMILMGKEPPQRWWPCLEEIYLDDYEGKSSLTNLSPLANLTSLQSLGLHGAKVFDISPLANLRALRKLKLGKTLVADLTPLAGLTALQELDLAGTLVSGLGALRQLVALQQLILRDTEVSNLASLANLVALEALVLSGTRVRDLSALSNLSALGTLMLFDTRISNLAPHRECANAPIAQRRGNGRFGAWASRGPSGPPESRPSEHTGLRHIGAADASEAQDTEPEGNANLRHRAAGSVRCSRRGRDARRNFAQEVRASPFWRDPQTQSTSTKPMTCRHCMSLINSLFIRRSADRC